MGGYLTLLGVAGKSHYCNSTGDVRSWRYNMAPECDVAVEGAAAGGAEHVCVQ